MSKVNRFKGLALALKDGERLQLQLGGVECWIGVAHLGGNKTRVVVDAPRTVKVLREQLVLLEEAKQCKQI